MNQVLTYTVAMMNVKEIFSRSIRDAGDHLFYNAVMEKNPFPGESAAAFGCGNHISGRENFYGIMKHLSEIGCEQAIKSLDVDTGSGSQPEINSLHHLQLPGQSLPAGNGSLSRLYILYVTPDIGMIPSPVGG